jgi:hypothetical protein
MVKLPSAALISFASALVLHAPAEARQPTRLTAKQRTICLSRGGQVKIMGLSGNEGCALPMSDAGKACTDHSQCKGGCYLDESKTPYPQRGEQAVGACAATDYPYGCRTGVSKGKSEGGLCAD